MFLFFSLMSSVMFLNRHCKCTMFFATFQTFWSFFRKESRDGSLILIYYLD